MLNSKAPCFMVRLDKIAANVSRLSSTIADKNTHHVNAVAWYIFIKTKQLRPSKICIGL